MDEYVRAILLGLLQALTEFLPISSSGHLVLAAHLFGPSANPLTFDVGLHVGTLVATLGYFWRDWLLILREGARDLFTHGVRLQRWGWQGCLGLSIALGTVPAVLVGVLLQSTIEASLRSPALVATLLVGGGLLLALADRAPRIVQRLDTVTPLHALLIGLAQGVALVPGVSRSGITTVAARLLHYDRPLATRFSFLLSAPAVLAAVTLTLGRALTGDEAVAWGPIIVGTVVAGVAGLAAIHWLLSFLQRHSLQPFAWYRVALGVSVLLVLATRT